MPTLRFTDIFWDTLQDHRNTSYYRMLRFKLLLFALAKTESSGPSSAADRPFSNIALKNIWHIRLHQDPEVTLFYAKRGNETVVAMIGDHSDYGYRGVNARAETRTAKRVNNAAETLDAPSPRWPTLKWQDPLDILTHPDLPELSREAGYALLDEIRQEQSDPIRFERKHGLSLMDVSETDFDAYMADLDRADELVTSVMATTVPGRFWMDHLDMAQGFEAKQRVLTP